MVPMGHMAGLGSAFTGAVSNAVSLSLGLIISQHFDGTLLPLAIGFSALSISTWFIIRWTERGNLATHHPS
jgi:DHA1 family bicyclomycin/chloramphenicol resistance-like MFS transporter